jgi:hypothetical protein
MSRLGEPVGEQGLVVSVSRVQLLLSEAANPLEIGSLEVGLLEVGFLEEGALEVGSLEVVCHEPEVFEHTDQARAELIAVQ